jgi:nitrous oxidase accessory protein NosD
MTFAVLAIAALALVVPASSTARTVHVETGESIQAAIDDARPGTTIKIEEGTYAESLLIDKDGIELVGEGRKKTKIVEPATPTVGEGCVFPPGPDQPEVTADGICVFDVDAEFNPRSEVDDVEISHLAVEGFNSGIFAFHTDDLEVTRTIEKDYDEYGVFLLDSRDAEIERNVTYNTRPSTGENAANPEAGIYIGESARANATIHKNVSWGNLFGIYVRDAAHGKVVENKSFSNCIGLLFLNFDETAVPPGQTPGETIHVADWLAEENFVTANNRECPGVPEEGLPPLSGIGIAVLGARDVDVIDNGVFGNAGREAFGSAFGGGILVGASPDTPTLISTDIKVAFNTALGNDPDLVVEAGNEARLLANDCLTSTPEGLCEDTEQSGHDGNGRDDNDHHGDKHHKKHKKHKGGKHKKHKNKKHFKHHDD